MMNHYDVFYVCDFDAEFFNKMKNVFPNTIAISNLNGEVHMDVGADACTSFLIVILVFDNGGSGSNDMYKGECNAYHQNSIKVNVSQTRNELRFLL